MRRCWRALLLWLAVVCGAARGVPLLFANRKDIRLLELDASGRRANGSSQVLVEGLEDAAALDFFYEGRLLFWTDVGLEVIRRRSLDPSSSSPQDLTVASMGVVSPDGLACDWVGRKLYWTDSETNRLEVAELDGAHRKVLLWRDLDQPRAIALVPTDGLLFWTDWGDVPKIERASMDGNLSTRRAIVREDIFWPNGLTVDYQARRIYWVDAKLKLISSMDYDGKNRAVVIHGSLSLPFALTVLGDTLYWTDWQARAVLSCSKQTGGHKRTVLSGDLDPMDIQAYSPLRQPKGGGTPCSYNNGGCSHLCLVSSQAPFYSCACPTGVRLLNDSRTCAQGAEQILLLARRKDLRRISLDTPDYTDVVLPLRGLRHAIALDYDPVEGRVYWTDDELCLIQRAFLNGSGQEAVVTLEVQHPDGLAVDPVARNLYWTDTGTDRIEVARLNGTARKVLVAEDLAEPRAIVLDPPHGWMYWTDWGQRAKIERAALDGSERAVLVSTGLGWPNGLALDAQDGRLYWADARTDRIESARLDGSDRRTLLDDQLPHVFGFTLLGDYIYWTDWQGRSIERLPKDPSEGQQRQVILDQLPDLMGLKAVSVRARPGTNDCSRPPNGGCSHLCLQRPRGQGRACACPTGLELRADLRGCTAPEAFLLYAQHDDVRRISLQSRRTDHVPLAGVREAAALDYDDGRLYWADTTLKRISRAFLNGSQAEPLVEFGLELPESLAVDWVGRNLYWADLALKRIEVSRLDGAHRRVLLWRGLDDPRALALEPSLRWMFWADWGSGIGGGGKGRRIERAALDGSQRLRLVTSQVGRVNSLSVDHGEQRLYWTDLDANHIESSDLAGERRRVVVAARPGQRPFGLAQYQEYLYWTDLEAHSIERALKASGADRSRLLGQLKYIDDLLVFHTSARRAGWNQCAVYNGGCSHLCLGVPGVRGYQCACPTHHPLGPNNRTCQRPQSFLLFSQKSSISRLGLEADDSPDVVLPIPGLKNIRALEYDPATDFLFWIDGKSHAIRRGRDNGTQVSALLPPSHAGGGHPYALALDPYGRQLFWSCSQGNLVNVSSPDDGRPLGTLLASGTDRPRHLALHPHLGVLVWSNLVVPALIERSFLDGSGRQTLVSGELRQPGALAMDCADERLYWSDVELRRVEHVRLGGDQRKVLLSNVQANALAVLGPHLFILDRTEQSILRAHKLTGAEVQPVQVRRSHLSALLAVRRLAAGQPCVGHSCSHLCRPVRGRAQCACPPGLVLRGPSECVPAAPCTEREFACASGGCVALEARCDGAADCTDRSDERDCPPGCAPGAEFRCRDGGCVPKPRLCDGNADCADGSDELCCGADRFACHSRDQCIDRSLVCNRRPDCVDRSDEVVCDAVSAGRPATTTVVLVIVFGSLTVLMAIGLCCYQQRARVAAAAAGHPAPVPHAAYRMLPYPKPPPSRPAPSSTASSNGTAYPRETLNPPPSPATVRSYGGPTPCSTDVCDDSEPCPCRFRCDDSLYDSDPNPPPPTPRSRGCVSDASCPPSPLNERAFCHPPPPSPVPESDY